MFYFKKDSFKYTYMTKVPQKNLKSCPNLREFRNNGGSSPPATPSRTPMRIVMSIPAICRHKLKGTQLKTF